MRWIKLIKNESKKTHYRKLKKRNYIKLKVIQLNSAASLFYIKYNTLLSFTHNQKYGLKSALFSQLLIEEVDIFFSLYYWLKLYYTKVY
uniref:ribosomal protein L20 n=1 Tax=Batrachospermum sp. TaxID=31373 RepID=UPI001FA7C694|nr:ribosomal protein L20 [Batrachospermum sp.]UNB13416.1 ribosomal protein L20 [Batrachospermum sp.]